MQNLSLLNNIVQVNKYDHAGYLTTKQPAIVGPVSQKRTKSIVEKGVVE